LEIDLTNPQPSNNPFHSPSPTDPASRPDPAVDASPAAMNKLRSPFAEDSTEGDDSDRRND
jgi:hypothetical protein